MLTASSQRWGRPNSRFLALVVLAVTVLWVQPVLVATAVADAAAVVTNATTSNVDVVVVVDDGAQSTRNDSNLTISAAGESGAADSTGGADAAKSDEGVVSVIEIADNNSSSPVIAGW